MTKIALILTVSSCAIAVATPAHARSFDVAADSAAPAVAQSAQEPATAAPAATTAESDDVIVTAQRRQERLQNVPISVSVAQGQKLADEGVRSLEDLSNRMPNVRVAQGSGGDQLHIRGAGSGFNAGFEQSVATFVDGVYRGRSRATRLTMFDLDRVEALKGPQTTFFGANAIAGALNIITRKPGTTFEGNASALWAPTDGEYAVSAAVSVPLTDTLSARIAGQWTGMDGYIVSDPLHLKGPNLDDKNGRLSIAWRPTSRLRVDVRVDLAKLRDANNFMPEIYSCPPIVGGLPAQGLCASTLATLAATGKTLDATIDHHSGSLVPGYFNMDAQEYEATARLDLDAVSLVSITGYTHHNAVNVNSPLTFPVPSILGAPGANVLNFTESFRQFSQELRLESTTPGPLSYMIGGYYEHGVLHTDTFSGFFFAPLGAFGVPYFRPTDLVTLRLLGDQTTTTWSGFGSLGYAVTDQLKLNLGLRYSSVVKVATRDASIGAITGTIPSADNYVAGDPRGQAMIAPFLGAALIPYANGRRNDKKLMYSANAQYQFTPDVMAYISYSTGFKAGGFSGNTADTFVPETVKAYEAGLKAQFFDRKLTTNLAVFYSDYTNLQDSQSLIAPSGAVVPAVSNVASAKMKGVEFSTRLQATKGLTLYADVAYLHARYGHYDKPPCGVRPAPCLGTLDGAPTTFAPTWSGSTSANYRAPLGSNLELRLNGTLYFSSSYYEQSAISDLVKQPAYAKLDLRAAFAIDDGKWEIALIGKNVTDKTTASFRSFAPGALGTAVGVADRPRSVAVQLNVKW